MRLRRSSPVKPAAAEVMAKVGERLREARERSGLTVKEIAARTKIRAALIDAMERGDFNQLPSGLLRRGFLRAYAREVGLDQESVVRDFLEQVEGARVSAPAMTRAAEDANEEADAARAGRPALTTLIVVGTVAAAAVFAYTRYSQDAPGSRGAARDAAAGDAAPVGASGPQSPVRANGEDVAVPAALAPVADGVSIAIAPSGPVWLEAVADGRQVMYRLVQPGERHVLEARDELRLRIGDAGAFAYTVNGVAGRPLGPPGAVRDVRIARDTVTAFQQQ